MDDLRTLLLLLSLCCVEFIAGQDFNCSSSGELRLNQAGYFEHRSGRVEICACSLGIDCQWATISVDISSTSWGWKNAQVACRELYPEDYGVINPILQDSLPTSVQASTDQFIYSNYVSCDGSEDRIIDCASLTSTTTSHYRDAHIRCRTDAPLHGDVRLAGPSTSNNVGLVEVYTTSWGWVTGCTDSWEAADANVTCVTLGYDSGVAVLLFGDANSPPIAVYDVGCIGTEPELALCSFSTTGTCSDNTVRAGVQCTASELFPGTSRLFPDQPIEGYDQRVEVLYDDRWGSICDSDWGTEDGTVVCNALVGSGTAQLVETPTFMSENRVRPIWLSSVTCEGSESSLSDCTYPYAIGYTPSCFHTNDAALVCNVDEGGLSGGEIAGIVIGVLVGLAIIGFIIHLSEQNKKKKAAEHQRHQAQLQAASAAARANAAREEAGRAEAARVARERAEEESAAQQATSGSHDDASALPRVESDTELRKGAPPSYDEALRFTSAFSSTGTDVPPTEQAERPEVSVPPYPASGGDPSHPPTADSSNLPYPNTSSGATPYPPVGMVGVPYPHADIALAPYPPTQAPYPQAGPEPGDVQSYPPPTNPGYPPPTNPGYPPPTNPAHPPPVNPAFALPPPVGFPDQPFTALTYHPNQPVQDIDAPLPPVLQPYDESAF